MLKISITMALKYSTISRNKVVTRFAPSPTGELHLGGLRSALYNYLLGHEFKLRIEDTDQARSVLGTDKRIADCLDTCGLKPSNDVLVQSERLDVYSKHANALLENRSAYRCFCSSERLQKAREQSQINKDGPYKYDGTCRNLSPETVESMLKEGKPHTIRLNVENTCKGEVVQVEDIVHGRVEFRRELLDDHILVKTDGYPTYHLASVIDDHLSDITHVVRGAEWLPSSPKHVLLYQAFGWDVPAWVHLPLLMDQSGRKLSKRQGHCSVDEYLDQGYLPSALLNFVALLGWRSGGGDTQELYYSLEELKNKFSLEDLSASNAIVDIKRLDWMNSQHIRHILFAKDDDDENVSYLIKELQKWIPEAESYGRDYNLCILRLLCQKVSTTRDFLELAKHFFVPFPDINSKVSTKMRTKVLDEHSINVLEDASDGFENIEWSHEHISSVVSTIAKKQKLKRKQVLMPLRWALTGIPVGADMVDTILLIGRDRCLERLEKGMLSIL